MIYLILTFHKNFLGVFFLLVWNSFKRCICVITWMKLEIEFTLWRLVTVSHIYSYSRLSVGRSLSLLWNTDWDKDSISDPNLVFRIGKAKANLDINSSVSIFCFGSTKQRTEHRGFENKAPSTDWCDSVRCEHWSIPIFLIVSRIKP